MTEEEEGKPITLFVAPYMASARVEAAKYCGEAGTPSVLWPDTPSLLHNVVEMPENDEVGRGCSPWPWHWLFWLVTWLAHRMMGVCARGRAAAATAYYVRLSHLSFGGASDVRQLRARLRVCAARHPGRRIVLFAASKGAATVMATLAELSQEERRALALVVLEAPFDALQSLLPRPLLAALEWLTRYERAQMTPLEAARFVPGDLPVAFITSRGDMSVPEALTLRLIEALRAAGHAMVHHLSLARAEHAAMPLGDPEDRAAYTHFMAQLYVQYGLSFL